MQCLNCGFENMPGLRACVRCESALTLGDVSVVPKRASSLRLATRADQLLNRLRSTTVAGLQLKIPNWLPRPKTQLRWLSLLRTALPGLGHLHSGQKIAGWTFLVVWAVFLLIGLVNFPSEASTWLFAGAVATHTAAVISIFAVDLSFQRMGLRALFGILLFIAMQQWVYQPLGRVAQLIWVPLVVPANLLAGPVLEAGEGVLYEGPWLRPDHFSRGDLVVYRIPSTSGNGYYSRDGYGVDRIVGVGGDEVSVESGRLLVNGMEPPSHEMPIGSLTLMPNLSIKLNQGEYAILPTRVSFNTNNIAMRTDVIRQVAITTDQFILGRIRYRLQPWSRFGSVE